jgi:hypothetical protein
LVRKLHSPEPSKGSRHRGNAGAEKPAPGAERDFGFGAVREKGPGNRGNILSRERAEGEIVGDAGCKGN